MSATLLFLLPIGLVAVVWSLCFVGACFPTSGLPGSSTPYSDLVLNESGILAYWPLSEPQGATQAKDITGNGHDGTYTIPPDYAATPVNSRPLNPPAANLGQGSIVPGDTGSAKNPNPASVDFEGGYVSIPWNTATSTSPDLPQFTLEAWIAPGWSDSKFLAAVFGAASPAASPNSNFVVFINEQNQLQVTIGNGSMLTVIPPNPTVTIDPSVPTYIAVSGDSSSGTIILFANAQDGSAMSQTIQATGFVGIDKTQLATFFIAAGDNTDTLRSAPKGAGAPQFPFQGQIQSVALYGAALNTNQMQGHFSNGSGG
ncbi:MAG TPA: hypothetical protein VFA80_17200 [Xanthobacteraceae bacterium]|nr:hypothetical protein [Xanthobacteraceae bacterium]